MASSTADWTSGLDDNNHIRFFRSADWAASPLGPLHAWSPALRLHTYTLLSDSRPAIIYWGPRKTAIYNEAFVPLAGKMHPSLMSIGFRDSFPEIWTNMKPIFDLAESSGKAVDVNNMALTVERNGYAEESFFTGNFNPLRESEGTVQGFYNALFESTGENLRARRGAMLDHLAIALDEHTPAAIGIQLMSRLSQNELDIPMAMLYLADDSLTSANSNMTLRGSIGLPDGHKLNIRHAPLQSDTGVFPLFRKTQLDVTTIPTCEKFAGMDWRGHLEPSKSITILPLVQAKRLFGYLIVGANPRRPIDQIYNQFMQDLAIRVSATIASSFDQQEVKAKQRQLEQGLAEREHQIQYMAQHAAVALANISLDGEILWANDNYFTLVAGSSLSPDHRLPFLSAVLPQDQPKVQQTWDKVIATGSVINIEAQMEKLFHPPGGGSVASTLLLSAFPYLKDGRVQSVMSCMTDVSQLKWAEAWQVREAKEALEAKARQVEFTDTISHEIRNPLSAVFQLADNIINSSDQSLISDLTLADCHSLIAEHIEAAKTILICANHQKRIVDDVLDLSKMDVMLSSLEPATTAPADLVREVIQILGPAPEANDIELVINQDASIAALDVNEIMCDPLRAKQILINILTNSIKFTKGQSIRRITLSYGATLTDPSAFFPTDTLWARSDESVEDPTSSDSWGTGQITYLTFSITDTGIGMLDDTIERMFRKFEQASPNTAVHYGGSGLGLFISQKLCKRHGGRIGVCSKPDHGSSFHFYVKVRKTHVKPRGPVKHSNVCESKETVGKLLDGIQALRLTAESNPPVKAQAPESINILLVEDNLVNQKILSKQLVKAGHKVQVANHGVEALDQLKQSSCWTEYKGQGQTIDLILMDCEMPVMDGLACTRQIRRLETLKQLTHHVPIIAVTANARQEQIDRARDAGVDEVVTKPFVVLDLIKVMRLAIP